MVLCVYAQGYVCERTSSPFNMTSLYTVSGSCHEVYSPGHEVSQPDSIADCQLISSIILG